MPSLQTLKPLGLVGARALINQYVPRVSYSTYQLAKRKAEGHLSCSTEFGNQVDGWLCQAIEHGWLDWGASECDWELEAALARKEPAACAARSAWLHLVAKGFVGVACQEQVPVTEWGLAPVLDLRGFDAQGNPTIVEIKCGWAQTTARTKDQLRPPFECVNSNHHTLAMLQLSVQLHCLQQKQQSSTGSGPEIRPENAWLLAISPKQCGEYETHLFHLKDELLRVSRKMIELHRETIVLADNNN